MDFRVLSIHRKWGSIMIKRIIDEAALRDCLTIFHEGYETVANEFGLTEENCPDRGRASLSYEKLLDEFLKESKQILGLYRDGNIVGLIGINRIDSNSYKIDDLIILPKYRGSGYGTQLLNFCKSLCIENGAKRIELGMIYENSRLGKWYESHGFRLIGKKVFEGSPVTIGIMECLL